MEDYVVFVELIDQVLEMTVIIEKNGMVVRKRDGNVLVVIKKNIILRIKNELVNIRKDI